MRTIIWFAFFWLIIFISFPALLKAKKLEKIGKKDESQALVQKMSVWWNGTLLKIAGVKVELRGLENIPQDRPVVFVGNHQGNFDIPVLLTHMPKPCSFVAKDAVEKLPIVRDWTYLMRCIYIDRDNFRQSVKALNYAAKMMIAEQRSVVIFPEGTRSRGGDMKRFKGGAFRIATKSKSPVLPFCIEGTYRAMEDGNGWIKPANVIVSFLPIIETANLTKEEQGELHNQAFDLIKAERDKILQEQK